MTQERVARERGGTGFPREETVALVGLIFMLTVTAAWWALALWPVQDAPVWLERARYVCFGVADSGLPDAGGWIGLTAGPAGMLAILVVGLRPGMQALFRRARSSLALAGTLLLLAAGAVAMIGAASARVWQARPPVFASPADVPPSTYPRLDREAPALVLTAHDGSVLDLADLRGRPVLLTFAYAHCSTICPLLIRNALDAQAELERSGTDVAVLVVTLDPWRDTPARLGAMAASWGFGARAWLLGGTVPEVAAVLDAWQVPRQRDERTGEITHPSLTYVLDADGRIAFASTGGTAALVSLVERLSQP